MAECIESSLAQTYVNWSHLVVDNASTDTTPEIVERYARADSRISLLRFEEFLPSAEGSHNRAFRQLDPDARYCKVVQADDWLFPTCLERMVEVAERHPNVGVVGAYRSNGGAVDLTGVPTDDAVLAGRRILRQCLLGGPYLTGGPTATMLRASLVRKRDPFYDPTFWHGDTEGIYWALTVSDMGYVRDVLTFVRRQGGTLTSYADRVGSHVPGNIRLLLRYGPVVLTEEEYRRQLVRDLRKYVRFHARQAAKLSRLHSPRLLRVPRERSRADP